jgi:hypothetical protein
VPGSQPRPGSIIARSTAHRPETRRKPRAFRGTGREGISYPSGVSARRINGLDAYFVADRMFACICGAGMDAFIEKRPPPKH